jgi:TonB family protein
MMLLVQPGISVEVWTKAEDTAAKLRATANGLFFQQACVTGRLSAKQNGASPAQLLLDDDATVSPHGPGPADWPADGLDTTCETGKSGPKVKNPRRAPKYPPEAMKRHIQSTVIFQALIGADGALENLRLVKSADPQYGLDHEAAETARSWTFEPAMKKRRPD